MPESICLNLNCRRPFTPNRPWHVYCCARCRFEGWILKRVEVNLKPRESRENKASRCDALIDLIRTGTSPKKT